MQVSARLYASNDTFFDATLSIYRVQHLQSRMPLGSEHWVLAHLLLEYLSVACRLVRGGLGGLKIRSIPLPCKVIN